METSAPRFSILTPWVDKYSGNEKGKTSTPQALPLKEVWSSFGVIFEDEPDTSFSASPHPVEDHHFSSLLVGQGEVGAALNSLDCVDVFSI